MYIVAQFRSPRLRRGVLGMANRVWGNEVVMDYLKFGTYEYSVPFRRNVKFQVRPRGGVKWHVGGMAAWCGLVRWHLSHG